MTPEVEQAAIRLKDLMLRLPQAERVDLQTLIAYHAHDERANLGCATSDELIQELAVRFDVQAVSATDATKANVTSHLYSVKAAFDLVGLLQYRTIDPT